MEEVVVTASRRETLLQDVPVSMAVVSEELIIDADVTNLAELERVVPGVTFRASSRPGSEGFSIRGIGSFGTYTTATGLEQSVGIVVDDIFLGQATGAFNNLVDVNRVEVLRGPQGTLFGKNSSAGLVQVVTNRPGNEFETKLAVSYGNFDEYKVEGVLNVPVSDSVAVRVTGYDQGNDGYIENTFDGEMINSAGESGVRAQALVTGEKLETLVRLEWIGRDAVCCNLIPETLVPGGIQESLGGDVDVGKGEFEVAIDSDVYQEYDVLGASVATTYDLDERHEVNMILGYREVSSDDTQDVDLLPVNFVDLFYVEGEFEQASAEIRLVGSGVGNVDYQLGLFAFSRSHEDSGRQAGALGSATLSGRDILIDIESDSYAVYGEATFHLTPAFRAILGGRFTHETYDTEYERVIIPPGTSSFLGTLPMVYQADTSEDAWTGRGILQHDTNDSSMVYASVSRGYKGPATQTSADLIEGQFEPFTEPEYSWNYEIGYKASYPSIPADLSLAVFYSQFDDFQSLAYLPAAIASTIVIRNVGEASTRGVEAGGSIQPFMGFRLHGSIAYVDAKFDDFTNSPCYPGQTAAQGCIGGQFDASGERIGISPKWQVNLNARQDLPLKDMPFDLFAVANYNYRSEFNYSNNGDPGTVQEAYGILDLRAGVASKDGRYSLTLYLNNVSDEYFVGTLLPSGLDGPGGYMSYPNYEAQRRYGARLDMRW